MLLRLLVAKTLVKLSLANVFAAGLSARAVPAGVATLRSNEHIHFYYQTIKRKQMNAHLIVQKTKRFFWLIS